MKVSNNKLASNLSGLVAVFALAGCGGVQKAAETASLNGVSQTPCSTDFKAETIGPGSELRQLSVTGTSSNLKEVFYSDSKCTPATVTGMVEYQGSIKVGDAIANQPDERALDMTIDKTVATISSDKAVKLANAGTGLCGITDWALNAPREISGKNCLTGQYPQEKAVYMTAYKQVNNTISLADLPCRGDDKQTCGKDAPTEAKRTVHLNTTFQKQ